MAAAAGDLQDLALGLEPLPGEEPRHRLRERGGGALVDAAAFLADQKGHKVARTMAVRTGDEGVAAREPMGESLLHEEVQSAVDRDRCERPSLGLGRVAQHRDEIVRAEGPVGGVKRLQDLPADRGQAHALRLAGRLRPRDGAGRSLGLVGGMGAGAVIVRLVSAAGPGVRMSVRAGIGVPRVVMMVIVLGRHASS